MFFKLAKGYYGCFEGSALTINSLLGNNAPDSMSHYKQDMTCNQYLKEI